MTPAWISTMDTKDLKREVKLYTKMFTGGPGGICRPGDGNYEENRRDYGLMIEEMKSRGLALEAEEAYSRVSAYND